MELELAQDLEPQLELELEPMKITNFAVFGRRGGLEPKIDPEGD